MDRPFFWSSCPQGWHPNRGLGGRDGPEQPTGAWDGQVRALGGLRRGHLDGREPHINPSWDFFFLICALYNPRGDLKIVFFLLRFFKGEYRNLMCPYIIKLIGMGLGLTVWDLSNMIMGWFTGQFGLFGVKKEHVDRPLANCVGLGLALSSLIFFSVAARCDAQGPEDVVAKAIAECPEKAAKPSEACEAGPGSQISEESLSTTCPESSVSQIDLENQVSRASGNSTPCKSANLVLGLSMALFAGLLFGTTFDLPTALMQGTFGEDHSKMIMDYVFSHFCGIFGTASLALVIYAAVLRKRRHMPRRMILPAIASGVLWGIAQVAWFQANIDLGFAVAFPIIGSLPGIVGLIIGMACFGEVKSCKGRVWACLGMALRVPGVLLIAIST